MNIRRKPSYAILKLAKTTVINPGFWKLPKIINCVVIINFEIQGTKY